MFGAIAGAGGAVGLLLGGFLTEQLDWRWNLYINVLIALVAIVGAVLFVGKVEADGPRPKLDIPGTILVSAGLFGVVFGFANAETEGWESPLAWGVLAAAVLLLVGFVLWQRRAAHPLLPLAIVADRNRAASYIAILIAGAGMFGIFLFVTYFLQASLGFSPMQTGFSFMPMVLMLVLAAQLSTNLFLPRFGPKIMVPIGMALGTTGMLLLTRLTLDSVYAADVLPALMVLGFAMGTIMPAAMQTATLGVDRRFAGVASAMVNTSQQVGGSVGTALLNTIAATATTDYIAGHLPGSAETAAAGAVAGYAVAYGWGAAFFAVGGVVAALLFRRRPKSSAGTAPSGAVSEPVTALG